MYFGKNFKTMVEEEKISELPRAKELLRWCVILNNMTLIHGAKGEISFRTNKGFAITANSAWLNRLKPNDIVEVLDYSQADNTLHIRGKAEPSQESLMHHTIYKNRPEINAVFHIFDSTMQSAHSDLGIPQISGCDPREMLRTLNGSNALSLKGNGLVFLGASLQDAGDMIIKKHTDEFRMRLGRTF